MKKIFVLFLLSVITNAFAFGKGEKTLQNLGTATLKAFQKQDKVAFEKLFVTNKDIALLIKRSTLTDKEKERINEKLKTEAPWMQMKDNYDKLIKTAIQYGINWKNTVGGEVEYSTKTEKGVLTGKVSIRFKEQVSGKEFELRAKECVETASGWKLIDDVRLRQVNDEYDYYGEMSPMVDSLRMADSMAAAMAAYEAAMAAAYEDSMAVVNQMPDYCTQRTDSFELFLRSIPGKKNAQWIEATDSSDIHTSFISKKPIRITYDKSITEITAAYSRDCIPEIYIRSFGSERLLVDENTQVMLGFSDGAIYRLPNQADSNNFGDARIIFTGKEMDLARTKKIVSIRIETRTRNREMKLTPANSDELFQVMNALPH